MQFIALHNDSVQRITAITTNYLILIAKYIEQLMESPNMLSYALAIAVAISSLVLFSTAFVMSHIHRRDDFFWSGIGLFYALVLWYCAKNITGAVLLGQTAATALLVSYSWQTLKLRRVIANPAKAAEINNFSILRSINNLLKSKKPQVKVPTSPVEAPPKSKVTEQEIAIPDTPSEEKIADTPVSNPESKQPVEQQSNTAETTSKPVSKPIEEQAVPSTKNLQTQNSKPEPSLATTQQPEKTIVKDNQSSNETPEIPLKSDNLSITSPDKPEQVEAVTPANEPASETVKTPESEIPKKVSSMDTLETVEVAEVLEAIPEDETTNRDSDPDNVIEVTTTEIKVTKEVLQVESEGENNSEQNNT